MPDPYVRLAIAVYSKELEKMEDAARKAGLPVEQWLKQVALAAADARAARRYAPHQLTAIHRRAAERSHEWTEAELRAKGYPLYWSKAWLVSELEAGESYSSLAIKHGYNHRTISHHAVKHHGLEQHRTRADIYDLVTWPATVKQIADATDGDAVRAAKWASEAVADGRLVRVRRALYALPNAEKSTDKKG